MELYCHFCGMSKFRSSHLRASDLSRSLLLLFPVRCINCGKRRYAFVNRFLKLRSERKARHKMNRGTS